MIDELEITLIALSYFKDCPDSNFSTFYYELKQYIDYDKMTNHSKNNFIGEVYRIVTDLCHKSSEYPATTRYKLKERYL